jgi:uncharacterized membrane protein YhaH (DUF805 family)
MDWKWLLLSFRGRINRSKYWLAMVIFFAVGVAQTIVGLIAGRSLAFQVLEFVVNLGLFIAGLAVGIKRLHDRDKSAWWMLFFYVAPVVLVLFALFFGFVAAKAAGMTADSTALLFRVCALLAFAIGAWFFVELGCLRGTVGYNRFGPNPLGKA